MALRSSGTEGFGRTFADTGMALLESIFQGKSTQFVPFAAPERDMHEEAREEIFAGAGVRAVRPAGLTKLRKRWYPAKRLRLWVQA
jgi:hypothetical protein